MKSFFSLTLPQNFLDLIQVSEDLYFHYMSDLLFQIESTLTGLKIFSFHRKNVFEISDDFSFVG